jgi:hypothetical protein
MGISIQWEGAQVNLKMVSVILHDFLKLVLVGGGRVDTRRVWVSNWDPDNDIEVKCGHEVLVREIRLIGLILVLCNSIRVKLGYMFILKSRHIDITIIDTILPCTGVGKDWPILKVKDSGCKAIHFSVNTIDLGVKAGEGHHDLLQL